jgi:hypothetical protein
VGAIVFTCVWAIAALVVFRVRKGLPGPPQAARPRRLVRMRPGR